jgi:hypothetical protein
VIGRPARGRLGEAVNGVGNRGDDLLLVDDADVSLKQVTNSATRTVRGSVVQGHPGYASERERPSTGG